MILLKKNNHSFVNMKSHFQNVLEFNKAFGVETHFTRNKNIFKDNMKLLKYRLSLIDEEVTELRDAIKDKDFIEIIDALADIEYVVLGAYTALGINADKAFDIVHKSNMSKLCKTEEEAQDTVEYYRKNAAKLGYDSPNYRRSDDGIHYVVYNESTSKILKSIKYTPAKFDTLVNETPDTFDLELD